MKNGVNECKLTIEKAKIIDCLGILSWGVNALARKFLQTGYSKSMAGGLDGVIARCAREK